MKYLIQALDSRPGRVRLNDADLKQLLADVNSNRETKGSDDWYESLEKVVQELRSTPNAHWFLKPVAKKDVRDYHLFVLNPMDLGTVLKKVKTRAYKSKAEFKADLDLIWDNCLLYNSSPNHPIRVDVFHMKRKADHHLEFLVDASASLNDKDDGLLDPLKGSGAGGGTGAGGEDDESDDELTLKAAAAQGGSSSQAKRRESTVAPLDKGSLTAASKTSRVPSSTSAPARARSPPLSSRKPLTRSPTAMARFQDLDHAIETSSSASLVPSPAPVAAAARTDADSNGAGPSRIEPRRSIRANAARKKAKEEMKGVEPLGWEAGLSTGAKASTSEGAAAPAGGAAKDVRASIATGASSSAEPSPAPASASEEGQAERADGEDGGDLNLDEKWWRAVGHEDMLRAGLPDVPVMREDGSRQRKRRKVDGDRRKNGKGLKDEGQDTSRDATSAPLPPVASTSDLSAPQFPPPSAPSTSSSPNASSSFRTGPSLGSGTIHQTIHALQTARLSHDRFFALSAPSTSRRSRHPPLFTPEEEENATSPEGGSLPATATATETGDDDSDGDETAEAVERRRLEMERGRRVRIRPLQRTRAAVRAGREAASAAAAEEGAARGEGAADGQDSEPSIRTSKYTRKRRVRERTPVGGWEPSADEAISALKHSASLALAHAGFQGAGESAVETLADLLAEHLSNFGRTLRYYLEQEDQSLPPHDIVLHTLALNGAPDLAALERYALHDVPAYGRRMEDVAQRMRTAYQEELEANAEEDEALFADESDIYMSNFVEEQGEDFFGFRDLLDEADRAPPHDGVAADLLSVPSRLIHGQDRRTSTAKFVPDGNTSSSSSSSTAPPPPPSILFLPPSTASAPPSPPPALQASGDLVPPLALPSTTPTAPPPLQLPGDDPFDPAALGQLPAPAPAPPGNTKRKSAGEDREAVLLRPGDGEGRGSVEGEDGDGDGEGDAAGESGGKQQDAKDKGSGSTKTKPAVAAAAAPSSAPPSRKKTKLNGSPASVPVEGA